MNIFDPVADALRVSRPDGSDRRSYQWREDVKRIAERLSNEHRDFDGTRFLKLSGMEVDEPEDLDIRTQAGREAALAQHEADLRDEPGTYRGGHSEDGGDTFTIPEPEPVTADRFRTLLGLPERGSWSLGGRPPQESRARFVVVEMSQEGKRRRNLSGWVVDADRTAAFWVEDTVGRQYVVDVELVKKLSVNPGGNGQGIYTLIEDGQIVDHWARS